MILSLFLLLPALSPTSQEICSAPGALHGLTLHLSQSSAQPGVSVQLQCSVLFQTPATRVAFCKDGEEVSSQKGILGKLTYDYVHMVSSNSTGNYSCGYEIKDSDNRVTKSQLSPAQSFSITSGVSSSDSVGDSSSQGPDLKLVLGITVPVVILILGLAVVLYFLRKKGSKISATPATFLKRILSMTQWNSWDSPGTHGPREKRQRHMWPSLHSRTGVINAPVAEMQHSAQHSRITEPPKIKDNLQSHEARK